MPTKKTKTQADFESFTLLGLIKTYIISIILLLFFLDFRSCFILLWLMIIIVKHVRLLQTGMIF